MGRKIVLAAPAAGAVLHGRCRVIDGDTIAIDGFHIRLAGIDAPELDHPWGERSKWALVALCKGQSITVRLRPELSYDRLVGECFLPDGRDLAAEMVRSGMALDWPYFSGGRYGHLEPADARQKLWLAAARQAGRGRVPALEITTPTSYASDIKFRRPVACPPIPKLRYRGRRFWLSWLLIPAALGLMAGCSLMGQHTGSPMAGNQSNPSVTGEGAAPTNRFEVVASALNVRARPSGRAAVITTLPRGAVVETERISGSWMGITLSDGTIGWVYDDYLRPVP